ncbi:S8 family peptidase [Burkholderia metallica]|uniref:S8 family peptidase n=2 Tax=Burkholderia cepacia complex TaxID=87882 RepID=UPI000D1A4686|nr:S8 family serine peptidase [Burkholderia metallica]
MKRILLVAFILSAACALTNCVLVARERNPALAMQEMQTRLENMIVLAVAKPAESLALNAGSTMGGYAARESYTAASSARAALVAIAAQYGLRDVTSWPIPALGVHCAVFEVVDGTPSEQMMARLAADARVRLVEPLQTFHGLAESETAPRYGDLQHAPREIGADAAQRITLGNGVRIALIDTGVDTEHPDLRGRIAAARNFVDDDWRQFNQDVHGTEVGGIIAAGGMPGRVSGVAPRSNLIVLKACWQQRGGGTACNSLTLAKAIQAAIDARTQIVNLSLGGPPDPLLTALIQVALKRGMVVVGAVMPNGDLKGFPVGVPGVIAVDTAPASNDSSVGRVPAVLYAPGRDILTLTPGGHYDFVSGSSFATAHVTGAAALLVGVARNIDAAMLHNLLDRTSGTSRRYSRVINACRALAALDRGGCNEKDL